MSDFIAAVAERADLPEEAVREVMIDRGIREWLPGVPAAPLRITHVEFTGFKDLDGEVPRDPFRFAWDVPDGVSALASLTNSVGKTSAIEIIRWLLSGRSAVDAWVFARVRQAKLVFSIDDRVFTVEVERDDHSLAGSLKLEEKEVRRFDDSSFETVMEELLLPPLGLERIAMFQRGAGSTRGKVTESGWPFLIDALFVRPSELSTVIGGVSTLAGQLLQVYLALPWYDTLLQLRAASSESSQADTDARNAHKAQVQVHEDATGGIREDLDKARAELAGMDDAEAVAKELRASIHRADELGTAILEGAARVQAATGELAAAEDAHVLAGRALRNLDEREAAGQFFRALDPRACPRCTTVIDADRRQHELEDGVCSVCSREAHYEPDPTARERIQAQVASTQEAVDSARKALKEASTELDQFKVEEEAIRRSIGELSGNQARQRLEAQQALVYRLEGRLEERVAAEQAVERTGEDGDHVLSVLTAGKAEAEERVAQTAELFDELNAEILELGQRFGVSDLTEVNLGRNAHLPVVKKGTKYTYGRLPDGDKLRLKVAVALALLTVGARRGAGRHPGLLFVDSPGAEEISPDSLTTMVTELVKVAAQLDLQIIIGTARLGDVQTVLPADHLRTPNPGDTTLW
jgi:hypothetical protein